MGKTGEGPGHPFRGNQYAGGSSSGVFIKVGDALKAAGKLRPGEYLRWETTRRKPGDMLRRSRVYGDAVLTGRTLRGTSAIDPAHPFSAITRDFTSYEGDVYVVTGQPIGHGEDPGEVILADARVVRRLSHRGTLEMKQRDWCPDYYPDLLGLGLAKKVLGPKR